MAFSDPPPGPRRKRPWYLMAALVTAWLLGAMGLMSGGSIVAFHRESASEVRKSLDRDEERFFDPDERALFREKSEHFYQVREQAEKREFPLGVATLLLGGAMVALAARSMSGREGARGALVQVTLARAALVVLAYLLTPDIRAAAFAVAPAVGYVLVAGMAAEAAVCLLIVLALTREGSIAFFRGMSGSAWER
jgi:hypothetical protein